MQFVCCYLQAVFIFFSKNLINRPDGYEGRSKCFPSTVLLDRSMVRGFFLFVFFFLLFGFSFFSYSTAHVYFLLACFLGEL